MQNEFTNLIKELKEEILYLQELGVSSLNADLPDFQVSSPESKVQTPKSDFVVPEIPIIKKTEIKSEQAENRKPKLETERLSRLPKLSDFSVPNDYQKPIQPRVTEMPKKPVEPNPTETLFGDISQTLPESNETLADIKADIGKDCTRCRLCEQRTQVVNSVGNPNANLMFIGEAPGADEDAKGEPFVGRAGQLLNKIIEAIGMKREDVFIGNINRCRPPQNRQPQIDEAEICKPFLLREIAIVRPKVIVVLGNTACQNLLDTKVGITKLRGNFQDYFGVKVMPTFHPAYLLRDPSKKREAWEDMKKVRDYLNSLT